MLKRRVLVAFSLILSVLWISVRAQDEAPRQLWDSEFLKKRAGAKTPSSGARKTPAYKRTTPRPAAPDSTAPPDVSAERAVGEVVGVTIWRLRQSRAADNKEARLLLQEEATGEGAEFTPERVESETAFNAGDRVRLSIESPRDGFLYVIDREQYTDGTLSDPYLIFPTLRNRGGDNAVKAGKVIELPGRSAFRLTPMRADYQGELLTLIVTSTALTEIKVGPGITKLDRGLLEGFEQQWRTPFERFELSGGAGKPYTKAEKEAGEDGTRLLTQEDELPQTLYRVVQKPGNSLLIPVALKIVAK